MSSLVFKCQQDQRNIYDVPQYETNRRNCNFELTPVYNKHPPPEKVDLSLIRVYYMWMFMLHISVITYYYFNYIPADIL